MMKLLYAPHLDKLYGLRDYTILMLFYNTGIRVEEFCKLDVSDLKLPKRGEGQLKVVGKGNKIRCIPLNLTMKKVLKK